MFISTEQKWDSCIVPSFDIIKYFYYKFENLENYYHILKLCIRCVKTSNEISETQAVCGRTQDQTSNIEESRIICGRDAKRKVARKSCLTVGGSLSQLSISMNFRC